MNNPNVYNYWIAMALGLQLMHLVRLTIMPVIYYKIWLVQQVAPHDHEEGQGEGGAAH